MTILPNQEVVVRHFLAACIRLALAEYRQFERKWSLGLDMQACKI